MRMFFVLFFLCVGCCGNRTTTFSNGSNNSNVGVYSTIVGQLLKKHEKHDQRKVEFKVGEGVKMLILPSSLNEDWWINFIEGETYEVTIEEKNGCCGKETYIWHYKSPQHVLNEKQWKYEPLIGE